MADFLKCCEYTFEADKQRVNDPFMLATAGRDRFGQNTRLRGRFILGILTGQGKGGRASPLKI